MTDVLIPGGRDVRGTLEWPESEDASSIVVACPPHPEHGGHRGDRRLIAVSDALADRGVACLRFDYGEWDEGYGEREDVRNAIRWAAERERFDRVGVFGYSFGASEAMLASASLNEGEEGAGASPLVDAVVALAPTARLGQRSDPDSDSDPNSDFDPDPDPDLDLDLDVVAALEELACPVAICYGTRDATVEWEPVVERVRELRDRDTGSLDSIELVEHGSDHFFVGQHPKIAERVGSFFERVFE